MANEVDLQQFCANREDTRSYLQTPFSIGEFTYATNGHIMVRVPRRPIVAGFAGPPLKEGTFDTPLTGLSEAAFAVPTFKLPEGHDLGDCSLCGGTGAKDHDCPCCECQCEACDGSGINGKKVSVMVHGAPVRLHYARQMLALPSIEVSEKGAPDTPLLFRFDGGVGALMALKRNYDIHLDVLEASS